MAQKPTFDHWTRYWQAGHVTSLPEDFSGLYNGEIEAFWAAIAAELPTGAEVLDVCAGNAPVALLIARHAPSARVIAADAAAIDRDQVVAAHPTLRDLAERITFAPSLRAEAVATLERRFDLVTSQYGLEYTNWQASAAAVASVLAPGGRLALIAHVPTSAMVQVMESEQQAYDALEASGVPRALRDLARASFQSAGGARKRLKREAIPLRADAGGQVLLTSIVRSIDALLAMDGTRLMAQQAAIEGYVADLLAGRERARDLLMANRRIFEQERWFEVFSAAGLELIAENELSYAGRHRCGLALVFRKAGP